MQHSHRLSPSEQPGSGGDRGCLPLFSWGGFKHINPRCFYRLSEVHSPRDPALRLGRIPLCVSR